MAPRRRTTLLPVLGGAAVGAAAAIAVLYVARHVPAFHRTPGQRLGEIAGLLALALLALALHEAGHLLAGRLAGFRPVLYVVGPLRLERIGDRWTARFNRRPGMWGGLAGSLPTTGVDARRGMRIAVAGGPLASLAGGALALAAFHFSPLSRLPVDAGHGAIWAALALMVFGVLSLGIAVVTLLPGRSGGLYTDGERLRRLRPGAPHAEAEAALLTLAGVSLSGVRPRDWSVSLMERALELPPDGPMGVSALELGYAAALDRGDVAAARVRLDAALAAADALSATARAGLLEEAALFAALRDGDSARARALLARADGHSFGTDCTRAMAEAAVLLDEGRRESARARLAQARATLSRLHAGVARMRSDLLAELEARSLQT